MIPAASCTCCQTYEITGTDGPLVCSTSLLISPVSFIDFHLFWSTALFPLLWQGRNHRGQPHLSVPSLKLKLCIIRYLLGLTPLKCASNRSFRTYRLWSEEPFLDMGIMSDTLPWSFNFGLSKRMALQTMVHKSQSSRFICTESEKGDKYKQGKCKFCYPRAETSIVYFFWETCELRKVAHSCGRECFLVDAHPQGEVFKWQIIHYIRR